jgi:hypothetical protein
MRIAILIAVPAAFLAAGCTPIDVGLGEAVRHNVALQTLDPDPHYEEVVMEGGSGDRAALAQKRYREGKVIEPVTYRTTSGSGAGGGSGGGGSGPR